MGREEREVKLECISRKGAMPVMYLLKGHSSHEGNFDIQESG